MNSTSTPLLLSSWSVTTTATEKHEYRSAKANAIETREDRKLRSLTNTCTYRGKNKERKMREIRNPDSWIGKRIPASYGKYPMPTDYDTCDWCNRWFRADDLHNILYPVCDFDWKLMMHLHIEEAQGFCPCCLSKLEAKADEFDPNWLQVHYAGIEAEMERHTALRNERAAQLRTLDRIAALEGTK